MTILKICAIAIPVLLTANIGCQRSKSKAKHSVVAAVTKVSSEAGEEGGTVTLDDGTEAAFPAGALALGTVVAVENVATPTALADARFQPLSKAVQVSGTSATGETVSYAATPLTLSLAINESPPVALALAPFVDSEDLCILGNTPQFPLLYYPRANFDIVDGAKGKLVQFKSFAFGTYMLARCTDKAALVSALLVSREGRIQKIDIEKSTLTVSVATMKVGDTIIATLKTIGVDGQILYIADANVGLSASPADIGTIASQAPRTDGVYTFEFLAAAGGSLGLIITIGSEKAAVRTLATIAAAVTTPTTTASAPTKLALTADNTNPAAGTCATLSVTTQDTGGTAANTAAAVTVNLSGGDMGNFYSDAGCATTTSSIEIAAATNSKLVYYKNVHLETRLSLAAADSTDKLTAASLALSSSGTGIGLIGTVLGRTTCAKLVSGALWCWYTSHHGFNSQAPFMPAPLPGFADSARGIAQGPDHTCVLNAAGSVSCWGQNGSGQLGDGTTAPKAAPVVVTTLESSASAIAAGHNSTCALLSSGEVKCWGNGSYGQLGNGTTSASSTPVSANFGGSKASAIAGGSRHYCALAGGTVKCWGQGGRLGDGSTSDSSTPVDVTLGGTATAIAAGNEHNCALLTDGSVKCWGPSSNGALGDGSNTQRLTPVAVTLSTAATAITTGSSHTCALLSTGQISCWGYNNYGGLGNGSTANSNSPVAVTLPGESAKAIAGGEYSTCALLSNGGTIKCWGIRAASGMAVTSGDGFLAGGHMSLPLAISSFVVSGAASGLSMAPLLHPSANVCSPVAIYSTSAPRTLSRFLSRNVPLTLTTGAAFYQDSTCTTAITTTELKTGTNSSMIFFKGPTAETQLGVTATDSSLTAPNVGVTITPQGAS